jgi:hypothetical protein
VTSFVRESIISVEAIHIHDGALQALPVTKEVLHAMRQSLPVGIDGGVGGTIFIVSIVPWSTSLLFFDAISATNEVFTSLCDTSIPYVPSETSTLGH